MAPGASVQSIESPACELTDASHLSLLCIARDTHQGFLVPLQIDRWNAGCLGDGAGPSMSLFSSKPATAAHSVTMFIASTRRDDRRVGDAIGDAGVHHAMAMMSAPPGHQPGVMVGQPSEVLKVVIKFKV